MQYHEGKEKFIEAWGKLGSSWGICRTMAQLHALLLIAPRPMCADEIMDSLQISRGNANMNLRALIDWGLVHKVLKTGERKEFFEAEKDIMVVLKHIIKERKKRELEPMIEVLNEISCVHHDCKDSEEFCRVVDELKSYTTKADKTFETILNSEPNWIQRAFFRAL